MILTLSLASLLLSVPSSSTGVLVLTELRGLPEDEQETFRDKVSVMVYELGENNSISTQSASDLKDRSKAEDLKEALENQDDERIVRLVRGQTTYPFYIRCNVQRRLSTPQWDASLVLVEIASGRDLHQERFEIDGDLLVFYAQLEDSLARLLAHVPETQAAMSREYFYRKPTMYSWLPAGIALVGAGIGTYYGLEARDAVGVRDTTTDPDTFVAARDDAETFSRYSTAAWITSGISAALALGLFIYSESSETETDLQREIEVFFDGRGVGVQF